MESGKRVVFLAIATALILGCSASSARAATFSDIPKAELEKVKQLATEIDDVIQNVNKWLKQSQFPDLTDIQLQGLQQITTQYLLVDKEAELRFDRIWYVIAVCYRQSKFESIVEQRSRALGSKKWDAQNRYWYTGFYGRGFSQITWRRNYEMFSRIFGVDFVVHKELAVKPEYSSKILVTGMWKGLFGGYGIRDFINATKCDYYGCMKTLNQFDGTYAQQVAQYANQMRDAWGNPKGKCNTLPPSLQPSSEEMTIADSLKEKLLS